MRKKENQHILNQIRSRDARGRYCATDSKVMATDIGMSDYSQFWQGSEGLTSVTQSSQKKTLGMVAKSSEDGEEALAWKKSSGNG